MKRRWSWESARASPGRKNSEVWSTYALLARGDLATIEALLSSLF